MDIHPRQATELQHSGAALAGLEPLLTIETLAEYVGVPVATIYRWRTEGEGPCALRIGRHLRFPLSAVQTWLEGVRETTPGTASLER